MKPVLTERAHILLLDDASKAEKKALDDWFKKWKREYKTYGKPKRDQEDIILDMKLRCTKEALAELPQYVQCMSSWTEESEL